ncbi:MAG: U32 family peptidase [Coprobacillus cateniformis]|uniref:U32 family peptidase n=1 Tax=Longibaculum muris TaxID=1796628 RepID=UPI003AB6CA99|nr:U32 family peptidase [Coprobacillus cateniformis]
MRNIELLAPAGDQESLIAAVQNGANAIYLGGTLFNARAFAKNFDYEQMKWAVEYAHLHHVKIYVTVNTLYKDEEFEQLFSYIQDLYDLQVDALIIQDIGLFDIVRQCFPDFDVHMSTQSTIMNPYAAHYFEQLGATRIVLARENTIEEIRDICQSTSLEVEVFVHGAMCVCYSGQCLMSSMIGKRSGNRGACAQPCRLQYRLEKDGQLLENKIPYLLSPKDMMTIEHIGLLIEAGVTSFKIEGRMKRPEYVASVVKAYRHAIDSYLAKKKVDLKEDIAYMKAMFNRNYTSGYMNHDTYLLDGDYSGNKGIVIGEVVYYDRSHKRVSVLLQQDLYQGDSIVFEKIDKGRPVNKIYLNKKLVNQGKKGNTVEIEFDFPVSKGLVRKTIDKQVIEKMQKTYDKEYRQSAIKMSFYAHIGQNAQLTVEQGDYQITVKSPSLVEKALKTPLDEQRIKKQLSKLGQTPFYVQTMTIDSDDQIIMPIKELNELRREAVLLLSEQLSHQQIHQKHMPSLPQLPIQEAKKTTQIYVQVSTLEQLEWACQYPDFLIIYPYQSNFEKANHICQTYQKELILATPRVCKKQEIDEIKTIIKQQNVKTILVNDYGAYDAFKDSSRIVGIGLNVYNSYACHHYQLPTIVSLEMSLKNINQMQTDLSKCIVQVYGKVENMLSDYCPISQYYFGYQKKQCQICKQGKFALVDRKNEHFDIVCDEQCRMHLLNCHTLYLEQLDKLKAGGLFIHITNEDEQTTKFVFDEMISFIKYGNKPRIKEKIKTTSGYFKD